MFYAKSFKIAVHILSLLLCAFMSSYAYSAEIEHTTYTPITILVPIAAERPENPDYANKILVGFSDMSWIPASCNESKVYVESTDRVLVSTLLSAFMANKNVRPIVDTSVMLDNNFCKLVYAFVSQ
jgi:hypothetical protein